MNSINKKKPRIRWKNKKKNSKNNIKMNKSTRNKKKKRKNKSNKNTSLIHHCWCSCINTMIIQSKEEDNSNNLFVSTLFHFHFKLFDFVWSNSIHPLSMWCDCDKNIVIVMIKTSRRIHVHQNIHQYKFKRIIKLFNDVTIKNVTA